MPPVAPPSFHKKRSRMLSCAKTLELETQKMQLYPWETYNLVEIENITHKPKVMILIPQITHKISFFVL